MGRVHDAVNIWDDAAVCRIKTSWYETVPPHVEVLFNEALLSGDVVDLGCGMGRFLKYVKDHKSEVKYLGLDSSKPMLNEGKQLHPEYAHCFAHRNLMRPLPEGVRGKTLLCCAVMIHLPWEEQGKLLVNMLNSGANRILFDVTVSKDDKHRENIIGNSSGGKNYYVYNSAKRTDHRVQTLFKDKYRIRVDNYPCQKGYRRVYILDKWKKKLSVIMGTRNETVFLNLTVRSALEELKAVSGGSEIIVVDNSDKHFWQVQEEGKVRKGPVHGMIPHRYINRGDVVLLRQEEPCFTKARMTAAEHASGEYLYCVDSHVLFGRDVLRDAVAFMNQQEKNPKMGFGHSPICWAGQHESTKKHQLAPKPGAHHGWNWDGYYNKPSRMSWKFMPWICRRDWYLNTLRGYGCLADHMIGWGGAELLQQCKALMLGYENWAIPGSPVIHIGPYGSLDRQQTGYRYRTYGSSGNGPPGIGVLAAWYVLLGEEGYEHVLSHQNRMQSRYGMTLTPELWDQARNIAKEEHEWLKERQVMTYWQLLEEQPWSQNGSHSRAWGVDRNSVGNHLASGQGAGYQPNRPAQSNVTSSELSSQRRQVHDA